MVLLDMPAMSRDTQVAWVEGERRVGSAMGAINLLTVSLVESIGEVVARDGWVGHGIHSPEQWVAWKAGVSLRRARDLVAIARRRADLPVCWGLFAEGRLTEDAMARIAHRVPASHDAEVASLAPNILIAQLTRALACLPPLEEPEPPRHRVRFHRTHTAGDGWMRGEYALPPDEAALLALGLRAARDAEFRDRQDLPVDAEVTDGQARTIDGALMRMATEAVDGLDVTLDRTGRRGERHQVILHHHVDADGRVGPGRLHLGPFVSDTTARYLACEARVIVMAHRAGELLGINPAERTPNRRLRRYLEDRDGGCVHPLCAQRRHLHSHHLWHWEDGGPTIASNLVCLCPRHHRALHHGDLTIDGNPERRDLRFTDGHGTTIEPPDLGAHPLPPPHPDRHTYQQPDGGRFPLHAISWS